MEEVKLSLFTDDTILHINNIEQRTRKLLELINKLRKVAGYRNTQKSVVFLHTNNEQTEKEIKKAIPCATTSKK